MINVTVKRDKSINEIRIVGHAKYDIYGKDIVCAGVSSALVTTVNACLRFDENSIEYNEDNDFFLRNVKKDDITNVLLENLVEILKSIQIKYKKYIIVKEED